MRPVPTQRLRLFFAAALLAALPAAAQSAEAQSAAAQSAAPYTLVVGGQSFTLPCETVEGTEFIPLASLAGAFKAPLQRDPVSGDPVLTVGRARVSVSLRQPFASIDNRVVPLDAAPRQKDGEIWVSADFVEAALGAALGEPVRRDRARRLIEVGGEKSLRVTVRTTGVETGTRITFELSRKVPYTLRQSGRKLYLSLEAASLEAPFELREIGSPVARRVKLLRSERDKGFVIELGRDFGSYELIEGANPPSLVVDLKRQGAEARAAAPGVPAGGTSAAPAPGAAPSPSAALPSVPAPSTAATPRGGRRDDATPVIVIDPGHGGEERGATGPAGLLEKDLTLDVAQRLKSRLERGSRVRVLLTREDDRTLPLTERTAFANEQHADLFVSVHANASRRQDATGAETYYLSYQATDAEAQALAAAENASAPGSAPVPARPDLRMVLWDLAQAEHLRESSNLAEAVQGELNALLGLRDRGVKQAPFRVLMGATMPAVLIEIGFITNPEEENKLKSPAYRESLALAISQSIQRFREDLARRAGPAGRAGTAP